MTNSSVIFLNERGARAGAKFARFFHLNIDLLSKVFLKIINKEIKSYKSKSGIPAHT
jgi:hypothetical protein